MHSNEEEKEKQARHTQNKATKKKKEEVRIKRGYKTKQTGNLIKMNICRKC